MKSMQGLPVTQGLLGWTLFILSTRTWPKPFPVQLVSHCTDPEDCNMLGQHVRLLLGAIRAVCPRPRAADRDSPLGQARGEQTQSWPLVPWSSKRPPGATRDLLAVARLPLSCHGTRPWCTRTAPGPGLMLPKGLWRRPGAAGEGDRCVLLSKPACSGLGYAVSGAASRSSWPHGQGRAAVEGSCTRPRVQLETFL